MIDMLILRFSSACFVYCLILLPDALSSGKKKSKLPPPPPNPNVHGWDQSPAYLRGKWKLTSINKTAEGYDDLLDIIQ